MNANKQEAVTRARNILLDQQRILRSKILMNRRSLKEIARESAIHKRELGVLNEAIRALDDKPKKVKKIPAHDAQCQCNLCKIYQDKKDRPHPTLCECFMCKPY